MATPPYVVSGTSIASAWGNQIADSVVNAFASTAARSSAITSPTAGMVQYLTTNDATEGIECYNSAGSYTKSWNMPWGYITSATTTTDQTGITTLADLTSLTVTFTAVSNRRYLVKLKIQVVSTSGSPAVQQLVIANGSGTVYPGGGQEVTHISLASNNRSVSAECEITGLSGSSTVKGQFGRAGGDTATYSAVNSSNTGIISVYDVGPSGAPA